MRSLPLLKNTEPHIFLSLFTTNWGSSKIDPVFGQVYKPTGGKGDYPRCTIEQFFKIAKDLKIDTVSKNRVPCKANPGQEHSHYPPDLYLAAVVLFRWRCGLEVIHHNMGPSVGAVIRDFYQCLQKLCPLVKRG